MYSLAFGLMTSAWPHQHCEVSFWLLAILLLILLNRCLWSGKQISLNSCGRSDDPMLLNSCWQFGDILLLSSNDMICSFNSIRGSNNCFLKKVSNSYCYFLLLVFLQHRYLLVSSHLSWLHWTQISYPVFIPFVLRIPRRTCAPIFLAHITRFLEVRPLWEPGTRISTGILFPFRLFPKVSCANIC